LAEYFHTIGDMNQALKIVDAAIDIYPGAVGPLVFRARTSLVKDGNPKLASHYADLIDDKTDLDYYYIQAEIMVYNNEAEKANDYLLDKYSEVNEDDRQDYLLDVATLFADYELWDYADSWSQNYEDKEESDYLELQGRLMSARQEYDKAEEVFNLLLDRNPFSTAYWNLLACTNFYAKDFQKCISSCDYALAIQPDNADALLTKANALFYVGNIEDAVANYVHYMKVCGEDIPDDVDLEDYFKQIMNTQ
jgi:tetratricopeptide (TPR) repeat protein